MDIKEDKYLIAYQQKGIETFSYVIDFLNKHNLRWWVAAGTLIGAIRHNGYIPWDDDIDIFMPREDYEKLIALKDELTHPLALIDFYEYGYNYLWAKFYNKDTTIYEGPQFPFVLGLWIDVFPLDSTEQQSVEKVQANYRREFRKGVSGRYVYSFEAIRTFFRRKQYKALFVYLIEFLISKSAKKRRFKNFLSFHKSFVENSQGNYYVQLYAPYKSFKKEDFADYISIPFENIMVRVPNGYDRVLRNVYGDYMNLPPEEQRIPRHNIYYANLKEGITLEEVIRRMKAGEQCVF